MANDKELAKIAALLLQVRNATILTGIALAGGVGADDRAIDAVTALDALAVKYELLRPVRPN